MHDAVVTIATTNYDRAVELAALQIGERVVDGFPPFSGEELVEWSGFENALGIRLLKVHGSTNWYHDDERRRTWKLRHAMPLFGAIHVTIESSDPVRLGSALVLPSREKTVTYPPYPDLAYEFRKAADMADLAVFVGTSLRDPDLFALATRCAERKPTLVVGRSSATSIGLSIQMSASRFLISVLPRMARASDVESAVGLAAAETGNLDPILADVVAALDTNSGVADRCEAIDSLAGSRVALGRQQVERLLRDDADDVRTYGLGLVRDSPAADELVALVATLAEAAPNTNFAREAGLLAQLG